MSKNNNFDQFDLLEDLEELAVPRPHIRHRLAPGKRPRLKDVYHIIDEPEVVAAINAQADDARSFAFTYQASRTEAGWLVESLGQLYEHQWFDDVLQIVKGGKEASVYMCKGSANSGVDLLAAKVYRPRELRAMRNYSAYKEGRAMLDEDGLGIHREGQLKAIHARSNLGNELIHQSWIMHEVLAMTALHEAGFDVPPVIANGYNAILMGYIGDEQMAAQALHDVELDETEARTLFERALHNIAGMLAMDIIHGDLSAYNILYWEGDIHLIDFPQVVTPKGNRQAFSLFRRDVTRVCQYFRRQGVLSDPEELSRKLWSSRGMRTGPEADPAFLDPENPDDRAYWEKYK